MSNYDLATKCVQSGYKPANGEPRVMPIVQSTTYKYDSSETMAKLFDLAEPGYFYTRLANPTNDYVAQKICDLEGGVAAILTSSGQAASLYSILNVAEAGDHIVCSAAIYGGTFNLFSVTMKRMGIEFTFVDPDCDAKTLDQAFRPNTKALFGESISNPSLQIIDINMFVKAAQKHGVPLIIDNTFPTPINFRPLEHGANVVIHSTTKYMDGHATSVGGCIVDGGNFDWNSHPDKFPSFSTPDESYHGVIYTEAFGNAAYFAKILAQLMRDLGAIPSPHNAFLLNLGLETLHLRMKQHCSNALEVAEYLQNHPKVKWIKHPGLPGDQYYERAREFMPEELVVSFPLGLKEDERVHKALWTTLI